MGVTLWLLAANPAWGVSAPTTSAGLGSFDGLRAVFLRLNPGMESCTASPTPTVPSCTLGAAHWQQFQAVAAQVLGTPLNYLQARSAFIDGATIPVPARADARTRDHLAGRMALLGYTPREIAEVTGGRLPLYALQQADRLRTLGYGETAVAAYLERHYRPAALAVAEAEPAQTPDDMPSTAGPAQDLAAFEVLPARQSERARLDHHVSRYAHSYGVDPKLVRAVITHESSWRPHARSPVGAVGLMQLMPSTAQMLGIDPADPEQNIEGGVRYLSGLLHMFNGDIDAALVGYNAGPAFAKKWRQGKTTLYGETRNYLQRVKQSYLDAGTPNQN